MCIYDVYGPCSCPHGRCFTILAQGFAIGSWITSMLALTSCFYVSVRPIPEEGEIEEPKEGFGWMSRQIAVMQEPAYGKQCVWYTAEERSLYFDSMWNAGFAMALIACILGLVVMSTVLCTCCVAFQLPTFDGLFWTCTICFVAQCLSFLSWGSELCDEYECTWSSGTGMNLTAAMMWVWAANMIKSFPEALPPRTRGNRRNRGQGDDDDDDDDDEDSNNDDDEDDYGPCGTLAVYKLKQPEASKTPSIFDEMNQLLSDIVISQVSGTLNSKTDFYIEEEYEEEIIED
mmetsp:Transcript_10900/g.27620  ORF Transcript_10900/g.27620 Transcript_10900/m.27620 type:complete len:288 (-) Transcript_10900:1635-2498(-)